MVSPKEMGGSGDGHNPEQLFALGYSGESNGVTVDVPVKVRPFASYGSVR